MLMTFEKASELISAGKVLHIAGTEALLKKLPSGKWIGGSTEYFMAKEGGRVSGDLLFVIEFPYQNFSIKTYNTADLEKVATDAYDNGFTILIVPFDSAIHREYAENAAGYPDMFIKNITGWVSGLNLNKQGQVPVTVNGLTGEVYTDKAVAMHLCVPDGKTVILNIINIFEQDETSPLIEFEHDGFSAESCLVDGKKVNLADYISQSKINTMLPLVGDYSGNGVNTSFKAVDQGKVHFYAPVFSGIKYRLAKNILNYENEFNSRLAGIKDADAVFSCNCILNFLYGELEGKTIEVFDGPITFGEIAYQLVNQTLVYVTVTK